MTRKTEAHTPPESGTPFPAETATRGPLEQEAGIPSSVTEAAHAGGTATDGELPPEERLRLGIEDNVRHTSSLGRR